MLIIGEEKKYTKKEVMQVKYGINQLKLMNFLPILEQEQNDDKIRLG